MKFHLSKRVKVMRNPASSELLTTWDMLEVILRSAEMAQIFGKLRMRDDGNYWFKEDQMVSRKWDPTESERQALDIAEAFELKIHRAPDNGTRKLIIRYAFEACRSRALKADRNLSD